jgi:hypothetical protein
LRKRDKIISLCFALWLLFVAIGCQSISDNRLNAAKVEPSPVSPLPSAVPETTIVIDVPKFAYKSPAEFEQVLGKAIEIKAVKGDAKQMPGEYRLYQMPNHPQGLSVHFYGGKALIFNLVLGESSKSTGDALSKYFAINVKDAQPIEKTRFLEKWQGKFDGVNFTSVYAMKERIERDDYKLLHAEVSK